MKQKEIRAEVFEALQNGDSKSEIYSRYSEKEEESFVRKLLSLRPAPDISSSQIRLFKWLKVLWILFLLLELFTFLDFLIDLNFGSLISFIISVNLCIYINRFQGNAFLPGMIWLSWGLINTILELINVPLYSDDFGIILFIAIIYFLIAFPALILMQKIKREVFPYFNGFSPAKNENGEILFE